MKFYDSPLFSCLLLGEQSKMLSSFHMGSGNGLLSRAFGAGSVRPQDAAMAEPNQVQCMHVGWDGQKIDIS